MKPQYIFIAHCGLWESIYPSASLVPLKQGDSFIYVLNSSPVLGEVPIGRWGFIF